MNFERVWAHIGLCWSQDERLMKYCKLSLRNARKKMSVIVGWDFFLVLILFLFCF